MLARITVYLFVSAFLSGAFMGLKDVLYSWE